MYIAKKSMKLSEHLTIKEFTGKSDSLPNELLSSAINLAENIFEPIREYRGAPIRINSGYRSPAYNKKIGGAKNSQHTKAEALDLPLTKDEFLWIVKNLNFDQLIYEFGDDNKPAWVHVSLSATGKQRKQVLRAVKISGKTVYKPYF